MIIIITNGIIDRRSDDAPVLIGFASPNASMRLWKQASTTRPAKSYVRRSLTGLKTKTEKVRHLLDFVP